MAECERLELPIGALSELEDVAAGAWLVSVTESIERDWLFEADCCLFACDAGVAGVGVLDAEGGEEVGVRELVVEVGVVELLGPTELWLGVDETDGVCSGY